MNEALATVERILDLEDKVATLQTSNARLQRHINILCKAVDPAATELLAVRYVYNYHHNSDSLNPRAGTHPATTTKGPDGPEGSVVAITGDGQFSSTLTGP